MKNTFRHFRCPVAGGWLALAGLGLCWNTAGLAQTQLDLRTQSKNIDFSQAPETRPMKTGGTVPSTCNPGDMFFNTSAPVGQNVYGCTATGSFALESGGAGLATQLGDFAMSNTTTAATLAIGAGCSALMPCNYVNNNVLVLSLTAPCTVTISGTVTSGTVYVFVAPNGLLTVGHNTTATLTAGGDCVVATAVTGFPDGSLLLGLPAFTSNVWNTVTGAMDRRGFLSAAAISAGTGVSTITDGATGVKTVSTDSTIIPQYTTGSGAPSGNCVSGRDFYTDTTNGNLWWCKLANTWAQANGSSATALPWLLPYGAGGGSTTPGTALNTNEVRYFRIYVPSGSQITPASILLLSQGGGAGGNGKGAIYSDPCGSGTTLIESSANLSWPTSGSVAALTFASPATLPAGTYWLAVTADFGSAAFAVVNNNVASLELNNTASTAQIISSRNGANASTGSGSTLAFPANCGTATTGWSTDGAPIVTLR
jgi:hypothetical protein